MVSKESTAIIRQMLCVIEWRRMEPKLEAEVKRGEKTKSVWRRLESRSRERGKIEED